MTERPTASNPKGPVQPAPLVTAVVESAGGGFGVTLNGTRVPTVAKQVLAVPTRALAQALADELSRHGRSAPMFALVSSCLDQIPPLRADIVTDVLSFLETDLLFYRAAEPADLVALQAERWDLFLTWLERLGLPRPRTTTGLAAQPQPPALADGVRRRLDALDDAEMLVARLGTRVTGSAVLGLALALRAFEVAKVFDAATADEAQQIRRYGPEAELTRRLATLQADLESLARFNALFHAA